MQSPHVATIEVPLPTAEERRGIHRVAHARRKTSRKLADFTPEQLAELSNGLSLVNLNVRARRRRGRPAGASTWRGSAS